MFSGEVKNCANPDCGKRFEAKVYNAIYCSADCRKVVTNKKLLDSYYQKKADKNKKRTCRTKDCNTTLSVYNKENICERCKRERYVKRLVSWGWSEDEVRRSIS